MYLCAKESDTLMKAWHTREGVLLTGRAGEPVTDLMKDELMFAAGVAVEKKTVSQDLHPAPVRIPLAVASLLNAIRSRYPEARDRNQVTLAVEGKVIYEKLVSVMDMLRQENFKVSIARLRS